MPAFQVPLPQQLVRSASSVCYDSLLVDIDAALLRASRWARCRSFETASAQDAFLALGAYRVLLVSRSSGPSPSAVVHRIAADIR